MSSSSSSAQQISRDEYERQAVEYTTQQVEQLNADVRSDPALGAKSTFFQNELNIRNGIPVFQGKHTRFVYDDDDEEIVDAVDVTQEAISAGPYVRTIEDLEHDDEDDEDDDFEGDGEYAYDDEDVEVDGEQLDDGELDDAVSNKFYDEHEDEQMDAPLDDNDVAAMLEDVAMELASVALDEQTLLARAQTQQ